MKEIKLFCDVCLKEFPPKEYSFLTGQITRIDSKLQPNLGTFEGHYCDDCTKKILEHIEKLTNESRTKHSKTEQ